jgi:hypothetical protein
MAKKSLEIPFVMPESMGGCADAYFATRNLRLAMDKEAAKLKAREIEIANHIINNLPKGDTGAAGRVARASITSKVVAQVKDWDLFWGYVFKMKDPSLLQRRVSDPAVAERWDNGKTVPGVEPFTVIGVSVTKL